MQGSLKLLVPDEGVGQIKIYDMANNTCSSAVVHENPIVALSLNPNGSIGASSSEYGTVIRVFQCSSMSVLHELRRGSMSARISSIVFSSDSGYLIASSNKSTIHIWNLEILSSNKPLWVIPTYFHYQRSYFKIRVKPEIHWTSEHTSQYGPSVCLTEEGILYVAHLDGNIYSYAVSNEPTLKNTFTYMDFEEEFLEEEREWTSLE